MARLARPVFPGQPQKMANAAGAISWQRVAGIHGDTVSQPVGTTASNPLRFPGQQHDAYLSLHYNYYRDYDPATGRYLETDPIGLEGGPNLYAYVDGNPVSRIDPTGELWWLAGGAAAGGGIELLSQAWRNAERGQLFNKECYDWGEVGREGAFGAATGGLGRAASVGRAGRSAQKAYNHEYRYADRIRARALQDPKSHNFPYSFDDGILGTKPIPQANDYNIYQKAGTMNGKSGVYEIGVTKDGVIDHRFFRPD